VSRHIEICERRGRRGRVQGLNELAVCLTVLLLSGGNRLPHTDSSKHFLTQPSMKTQKHECMDLLEDGLSGRLEDSKAHPGLIVTGHLAEPAQITLHRAQLSVGHGQRR
jgi:hypothetical protein